MTFFDEKIQQVTNDNLLLKRAFIFLADGDFKRADEYAEKTLDIDPENTMAYVAKLMVDFRVQSVKELIKYGSEFKSNLNYKKIMSYGDYKIKGELLSYVNHANETLYSDAKRFMEHKTIEYYKRAISSLEKIPDFKDSQNLLAICRGAIAEIIVDQKYNDAIALMREDNLESYLKAKKILNEIPNKKGSDKLIEQCDKEITYISALAELRKEHYRAARDMFKQITGWRDAEKHIKEIEDKIAQIKTRDKRFQRIAIIFVSCSLALILGFVIVMVSWNNATNNEFDKNFEYEEGSNSISITKYKGTDPDVVIPDSIRGKEIRYIYRSAFEDCKNISSVKIGSNVREISSYAFKNCTNLKSVNIPDGVTHIGEEAFANCTSLEKIIIPDSVKVMNNHVFDGCTNLRIYCEAYDRGLNWSIIWQGSGTVTWGYKGKK